MFNKKIIYTILFFLIAGFMVSCGGWENSNSDDHAAAKPKPKSMLKKKVDPMKDLGIGPIKELITFSGDVDDDLAKKGHSIYKEKCTACHKPSKKFIGPAPKGIFERRNPTWVMNMILNPDEMVQKDEVAKELLKEFNGSPMANQNLTEEEARAVLEYFRTL